MRVSELPTTATQNMFGKKFVLKVGNVRAGIFEELRGQNNEIVLHDQLYGPKDWVLKQWEKRYVNF